jgi:HD superfamily phosphohydrolase
MEQILDHFQRVGDIRRNAFEEMLKTGMAAALLHDIGHGPLSHSSEQFFNLNHEDNFKHEEISAEIVKRSPICDILEKADIPPKTIVKIIDHTISGQYTLISQLISSELDADRLDYLKRDSYFAGVGFGTIDLERIISMLRVFKGSGILANHAITLNKGKYAVEDYIVGRHLMYEAVYFHKATRGAEQLIVSAFRRAYDLKQSGLIPIEFEFVERDSPPSAEQILSMNDHTLFSTMTRWQHSTDSILSDICRRIIERRLLKSIDLTNERFHAYHDGIEKKFLELAERHNVNAKYLCPIDSWAVTRYKPYVVKSAEDQPSVITNIFVNDDSGVPTEISQLPDSEVISALTSKKYFDRLYMPEVMKAEAEALFKA